MKKLDNQTDLLQPVRYSSRILGILFFYSRPDTLTVVLKRPARAVGNPANNTTLITTITVGTPPRRLMRQANPKTYASLVPRGG